MLFATRTVNEVMTRYGSVTSVPITPCIAYRSAYKQYEEALEIENTKKTEESLLAKRKQPVDDQKKVFCRRRNENG